MYTPEEITKKTYDLTMQFLTRLLPSNQIQSVEKQFQAVFPSWDYFWQSIKAWLKKQPLNNVHDTIHGFAQFFPTYNSFASELNTSLSLHNVFWNQVHDNLCLAKEGLC